MQWLYIVLAGCALITNQDAAFWAFMVLANIWIAVREIKKP